MNEKAFYHAALNRSLLNGKALKKRIHTRIAAEDAIEETPRKAESKPVAPERSEWNPRPIPWIAIPVAAMLLLSTVTIGIAAGAIGFKSRHAATDDPNAIVAPADPDPADALNLVDLGCTVKLLPEFDEALKKECTDWRETHVNRNEPVYDEADWAWLKECGAEVLSVSLDDHDFRWTTRVSVPSTLPFTNLDPKSAEQSLELGLNEAYYTADGQADAHPFRIVNVSDTVIATDRTTAGTIGNSFRVARDAFDALPTDGVVTVTERIGVIDFKVEDMQRYFGSVAVIEHRFSFNAAALSDVPLYVLSNPTQATSADLLIDAAVADLPGAALYTGTVALDPLTDERLGTLVQYFAGSAELYENVMTQSELEARIAALEAEREAILLKGDDPSETDAALSEAREQLAAAPKERAEAKRVPIAFTEQNGTLSFGGVFEKDGERFEVSAVAAHAEYAAVAQYNDFRMQSMSPGRRYPAPASGTADAVREAAAREVAEKAAKDLAPHLTLASTALYQSTDGRLAHRFTYTPSIGGYPVRERMIAYETGDLIPGTYSAARGDTLTVLVDEAGIVSFSWSRVSRIDTLADAGARMQFPEILSSAIAVLRAEYPLNGEYPESVRIDRIALEYAYEPAASGETRLVPVWNFYGTLPIALKGDDPASGSVYGLRDDIAIVSIHAIDGTPATMLSKVPFASPTPDPGVPTPTPAPTLIPAPLTPAASEQPRYTNTPISTGNN